MIVTVEGWAGHFDLELDFIPGTPASWDYPGDAPELRLHFAEWFFRECDSIVVDSRRMDDQLRRLLLDAAYAKSKPEDFIPDDEYHDHRY